MFQNIKVRVRKHVAVKAENYVCTEKYAALLNVNTYVGTKYLKRFRKY